MIAAPPSRPGPIAIIVPTFRRPELLAALLDSLLPELRNQRATVIVGDNDCDPQIDELLRQYRDRLDCRYLPVPQRGVSQVRNALVAEAGRLVPDWRWLLMLDDDGRVEPGWLAAMLGCAEAHGADLIGGPVEGVLPPTAGALARNSIFARRRRSATGLVPMLNTTQNLGIGRTLLDRVSLPLFDSRYGASGGEDYDLFRRTIRAGGRLVWCDEAVVTEPAPPERLTTGALLHRYYSTGIYMSPIDRAHDGWSRGLLTAGKGLVRGTLEMMVGTVTRRRDLAAEGLLKSAHHLGRLGGLAGIRSARYVQGEKAS